MWFSAHVLGVLIFCLYPDVGRLAESTRIIYGNPLSAETSRIMRTYEDFGAYLRSFPAKYGNKIFRVNARTEESVSWQNILDKSHRIAKFLLDSGCSAGSVIGVYCEDSFEYPAILLAVMNIGATYTSIDVHLTQDDVINNFNLSRPSVIFTSSKVLPKINDIKRAVSSIRLIVDVDQTVFPEYGAPQFNYVERNKTDTAMISYTSGTTGAPKAVKQSHETWIYQMELYRTEKVAPFPSDAVVAALAPPGRTFELLATLASFVSGHKYIMILEYEHALYYAQKYGINTFWGNPVSISFLLGSIPSGVTNYRSVELVLMLGDPLTSEKETIMKNRFGCQLFYLSGQTETAGFSMISPWSYAHGRRPMPGTKAKIIDVRTGAELGPNQRGEFCIQGPLVSTGYIGPTITIIVDAEGWLHSGDYMYYDENSNFHVVGRVKTLMNCEGGLQMCPDELENVLLEHPDVENVVVVPVPAGGYDLPRAYIVKKRGSSVSADDIQQYMKGKLPPEKSLSGGVVFTDYLPIKNSKVVRGEVQKWVT